MNILNDISINLQNGKKKDVLALCQQAIDEGLPAEQILNQGLLAGMDVIGVQFKNNEIFVPQVLVAARAMSAGAEFLKPYLADAVVEKKGKVCIGTVEGDLHDIGKNLVVMMFEGKGFEVIDLGVDVFAGEVRSDGRGAAVRHHRMLISADDHHAADWVTCQSGGGGRASETGSRS